MKIAVRWKIWFFFVTFFFLFPMICAAESRFELTPRISVSQVYDDNVYLDATNEESDFMTTVSPGIKLMISSINNSLSLDYSPTWVWYDKYDKNNTVRHAGTLTLWQNIAEHLRFNLTDTYRKSEEPLEDIEEVEGVRTTRNTYERNTGSANLQYQFGQDDTLTFGYRHSLLENEDVTLDDGTIQNPFGGVTYWFDIRNGLELNYGFTKASFSRGDGSIAGDDYTGHDTDMKYIYRFTPHTKGSIGYDVATRNFDGLTEDYEVHEGSIGFDHTYSPDFSFSLRGGYFVQKNERSNDETGFSYNASMAKKFERGHFSIGGQGGWDEAYLEAERRGLTRYLGVNSRLEFMFIEGLNGYADGSFRQDRDSANREWQTLRGNCGFSLVVFRWFFLSLGYSYAQRDDDFDAQDYTDNRVMLTLTASRLYRW